MLLLRLCCGEYVSTKYDVRRDELEGGEIRWGEMREEMRERKGGGRRTHDYQPHHP